MEATHHKAISQVSVPKISLNIGKRAFSVAAPTIWNQLAITIKSSETIDTFHKKLKTYCLKLLLHHIIVAVYASMTTLACPHVKIAK